MYCQRGSLSNWSFVIRSVGLSYTSALRERIRVSPGHCKITTGYEWYVCGVISFANEYYPPEYQALTGSLIRSQKWNFKWRKWCVSGITESHRVSCSFFMIFEDFIHLVSVSPTRCAGIASTGVTILLFVVTPFDTEVVENVLAPCGFVFSGNNLI